jgi:protein TonB
MVDSSFTIKPYHWWLTVSVAIVLHVLLLINFKQENVDHADHVNIDQNEVIIGLKKLKQPLTVEKSTVIETVAASPVTVEPIKPEPVIKKKKTLKPEPVIKPKPKITTPTVSLPQVEPLTTISKQSDKSSKQNEKPPASANVSSESAITKKERNLYYAKLAQWLERHKRYPTIARRRNQQGQVIIQFVMNREGELLRYQLITPSEHHSLNSATIKMLERASPMPKPPKDLIGDKIELEYTIPVNFSLVK